MNFDIDMREDKVGELNIIMGNMFSGKSTELYRKIMRIHNVIPNPTKSIIIINHYFDTRISGDYGKTHDNTIFPAKKTSSLLSLLEDPNLDWNSIKYIAIDEAQFFEDLEEFCHLVVEKMKKIVYIAGLDGDYKQKKFGKILDLVPFADNVIKLHAICSICADGVTRAPFTKKHEIIIPNNRNQEKERVDIGGKEKYFPVCRKHL